MARIPDPHRDVRWAWGFVVLIVAGGILAQFLGYGIAVLWATTCPSRRRPPSARPSSSASPRCSWGWHPPQQPCTSASGPAGAVGTRGYVAAAIGALTVVYWLVTTVASLIILAMGGA